MEDDNNISIIEQEVEIFIFATVIMILELYGL